MTTTASGSRDRRGTLLDGHPVALRIGVCRGGRAGSSLRRGPPRERRGEGPLRGRRRREQQHAQLRRAVRGEQARAAGVRDDGEPVARGPPAAATRGAAPPPRTSGRCAARARRPRGPAPRRRRRRATRPRRGRRVDRPARPPGLACGPQSAARSGTGARPGRSRRGGGCPGWLGSSARYSSYLAEVDVRRVPEQHHGSRSQSGALPPSRAPPRRCRPTATRARATPGRVVPFVKLACSRAPGRMSPTLSGPMSRSPRGAAAARSAGALSRPRAAVRGGRGEGGSRRATPRSAQARGTASRRAPSAAVATTARSTGPSTSARDPAGPGARRRAVTPAPTAWSAPAYPPATRFREHALRRPGTRRERGWITATERGAKMRSNGCWVTFGL